MFLLSSHPVAVPVCVPGIHTRIPFANFGLWLHIRRMPGDMAQPYPSLQLSTRTKRVDSQLTRDARFEPWKDTIRALYVDGDMSQKDLREHMKLHYGLNQT